MFLKIRKKPHSGGFRIASSFHCSDDRHVILKEPFFSAPFSRKKRKKRFVLSLEHTKRFFRMTRWWIPGKTSVSNLTQIVKRHEGFNHI